MKKTVNIADYLSPNLIRFFSSKDRDEAIQTLVDALYVEGKISNAKEFQRAILEREAIVSTGIGMGIAIPHAKLPEYEDFFIVIGRLDKPVDWDSLDGSPVRLIFLIGGPDDKQTEYLQILSSLTQNIKDEERRKKILTLNSPHDIIQLLST